VKNHSPILSYIFLFPWFLLVSIAPTITINLSARFCGLWDGRINSGKFGVTHISCCTAVSGSSMPLSCSKSDLLSTSQSSLLTFGLTKSQRQLSQFSVLEMLSGLLSSSLYTRCQSNFLIRHTFNIWVRPPRRFFADKAGGRGDHSGILNAAAPSCWKFVRNALTISSVSEMYPTAVICLFWVCDFFWVPLRVWLPCHISNKLWTLAILCNCLSSASLFSSLWFSAWVHQQQL